MCITDLNFQLNADALTLALTTFPVVIRGETIIKVLLDCSSLCMFTPLVVCEKGMRLD